MNRWRELPYSRRLLWQMHVAEGLIVFAIFTAVGYIVWAAMRSN